MIILLILSAPITIVCGQNDKLTNWYSEIIKISSALHEKEVVSLKKEVLYDGSIIPIAPGMFTYESSDNSTDTIPFLYSYGRIAIEKYKFDRMISIAPDSAKLTVRIVFQPIRTAMSQKTNTGLNVICFYTSKKRLVDLYLNGDEVLNLHSFWAITTLNDCYKVAYVDYSTGGFYYYIPSEKKNKKSIVNKLDKLFSKQYCEGYSLLNYFNL